MQLMALRITQIVKEDKDEQMNKHKTSSVHKHLDKHTKHLKRLQAFPLTNHKSKPINKSFSVKPGVGVYWKYTEVFEDDVTL